jgi:hypothetical protein
VSDRSDEARRRFTLELSVARIEHIDALKREWGLRNRGAVLERLLDTIFATEEDEDEEEVSHDPPASALAVTGGQAASTQVELPLEEEDLDDEAALVLLGKGTIERLEEGLDPPDPSPSGSAPAARQAGGIDLPGFVRRRSDQLRRSLHRAPSPAPVSGGAALPRIPADLVEVALAAADDHWLQLYGKPANETVLEASMSWLARDIWPQSDQSEGRPFTWTAAMRVMEEWVAGWGEPQPSFARVMVTAGILEDPYSASTLTVRIPTLTRRFVHRFRRRRSGTSFQTLEHTMTLHGALRLLGLPTDPGERLTLRQIRDAYRDLALTHHPDSGGSLESMRRINEAYQLLKELYRRRNEA